MWSFYEPHVYNADKRCGLINLWIENPLGVYSCFATDNYKNNLTTLTYGPSGPTL